MHKQSSVLAGPYNNRHLTATALTQGFSRKTLSTALLGLMFASTAVAASAKNSEEGRNSSRDSLVVDRPIDVAAWALRWYARTGTDAVIGLVKGGNYVWENAPSQADLIPYVAGVGAGAASFVTQRMVVQGAVGAAMERPWWAVATIAGGTALKYAADNTEKGIEIVNSVTSALPNIPEATKEGYAVGASAAGAVALAVDLYDLAGAIKQRYETPRVDPAQEASVDTQYETAKSKLEKAERVLQKSKDNSALAERKRQETIGLRSTNPARRRAERFLKQALGELPAAEQRLIDAQKQFDTFQANRQTLAQSKIDLQTSVRNGLKAGASVALSDIRGISQTEVGTEVLKSAGFSASSFVHYVVMDPALDAWSAIKGDGGNVEIDGDLPDEILAPQKMENKTPIEVPNNETNISASNVTTSNNSTLIVFDPNATRTFGYKKVDERKIDGPLIEEPENDELKNDELKNDERKNDERKNDERKNEERKNEERKNEELKNDERKNDERKNEERKNEERKNEERKNEERKNEERKNEERKNEERKNEERKNEERKNEEQKNEDEEPEGEELEGEELEDEELEDEELDDQQDAGLKQPAAPPAGKAAIRPAAGSYNSNAWAANTMFQMNLSDRLGSYYHEGDSAQPGSAWIRYSGSSIRLKDSSRGLATKGDKNSVMMGVDMLVHSTDNRNQFSAGVMGGYGHFSGRTRSGSFNGSSTGKVDGHGIGLYGTYQQDSYARQGLYADSWLLWNQFDNTVKDGDRPTEKYDAKGVTASLELGYNILLAERNNVKYVLQPHTQIIYQNVRADNFREADGTRVSFLNGSRAQTVMGVRAAVQIPTGLTSAVTPYFDAGWLHSTQGYGVQLGDDGAHMDSGRNVGQLKLGVQGDLNRAVSLNVELFHNQGNEGYRETGGNVMATYRY